MRSEKASGFIPGKRTTRPDSTHCLRWCECCAVGGPLGVLFTTHSTSYHVNHYYFGLFGFAVNAIKIRSRHFNKTKPRIIYAPLPRSIWPCTDGLQPLLRTERNGKRAFAQCRHVSVATWYWERLVTVIYVWASKLSKLRLLPDSEVLIDRLLRFLFCATTTPFASLTKRFPAIDSIDLSFTQQLLILARVAKASGYKIGLATPIGHFIQPDLLFRPNACASTYVLAFRREIGATVRLPETGAYVGGERN